MQSVLVVEDDPSVRSFIEIILNLEGFSVVTASTGAEALEIVSRHAVDLITIDLGLADMPGLELSRRLHAAPGAARARQVIVSGSTPTPEQAALVDAVLTKPFDFSAFTAVVTDIASRPIPGDPLVDELDRILRGRLIESHYQPIVHLATGRLVGFEALARGPAGSPLQMPDKLFSEAHRCGRLTELDSLCTIAAIEGVRGFAVQPPLIFVNVEPSTLARPYSDELQALANTSRSFQVVAEYTERAVTRQLPALLYNTQRVRAKGDIVALDDLGCDIKALALLPLIQPEIVKLDMSLVHNPLTEVGATIAVAAADYADQRGAAIVAEGIETEAQLASALSLGATLGQGYLFGRPAPAREWRGIGARDFIDVAPRPTPPSLPSARTPFELAKRRATPRMGSGAFMAGMTRQLSAQAHTLGESAATFALVQDYRLVPGSARENFLENTMKTAVLGLLGVGVVEAAVPGAYLANLDRDEPLAGEWAAVVLGPHQATVLCARQTTSELPLLQRCFEFVLSHDRELAVEVAALLAVRIPPRPAATRTTALPTLASRSII